MAEHTPLSAEGRARRDAIRDELAARVPLEAARRRRRRAATRAAGVAAILAIAAGAWWWGSRPGATPAPTPSDPIAQAPGPAEPGIEIVRVQTRPGIAERYAVNPTVRAERIGDEELLALLAENGTPTGLVRTPDRVYLTSEIGDDEEAPDRESGA